jgi:hypothetical protein
MRLVFRAGFYIGSWQVKDANERFEAMQGPWWKRMFRR